MRSAFHACIMERTIKIALVGAGMFGGDVHARAYADLQRFGIAGQLARVGLDKYSRELAGVKFDLVAVATRSEKSAKKAAAAFKMALARFNFLTFFIVFE